MDNVPRPTGEDDQPAAASWPRTFRYCLIVLTERLPALAVLAAWLAGRRWPARPGFDAAAAA
jgi:hypothetical protein